MFINFLAHCGYIFLFYILSILLTFITYLCISCNFYVNIYDMRISVDKSVDNRHFIHNLPKNLPGRFSPGFNNILPFT